MNTLRSLIFVATFSAAASNLFAHALWVGSNRYTLDTTVKNAPSPKATLYAGWGHRLPIDEPLAADRFGGIELVAPNGQTQAVNTSSDGYHAGTVNLDSTGYWWATSVSRPAFSTQIKKEGGGVSHLSVPKNQVPAGSKIAESNHIRVFAKTLLWVKGMGSETPLSKSPLGHDLEIVLGENPTQLKAGAKLPIQVWFKGKPYKGDEIEVTAEHVASAYLGKSGKWSGDTNREGTVEVPITAGGVWVLLVTVFEPADTALASQADQTRYRATISFEVPGSDTPHSSAAD